MVPYEAGLDRTRGHVAVDLDSDGRVRLSVFDPSAGICGHAYLSLLELAKVACAVRGMAQSRDLDGEHLPW